MPTPAERKALLFLSSVMLLGTGVRAHRAMRDAASSDPAADAALERQIAAVDSVRGHPTERRRRSRKLRRAAARDTTRPAATPVRIVDIDRAAAEEIERLPRIGPVLAARIVADRDSLGPFGSLERLQRVKGVGPALAKTLGPHVTFSLTPRPSQADESDGRKRARPARARRAL